ncbi:MAG: hypothetical protein CVT77_06995 [Alphaproteobacteria bacterium HGW-Alphaproteobacteria-16]|nr:MAG: hypothetical protein CVT77_06995 [Alphaproteobacteria bacterium HGW-Alphaproteobacteria-16]
MNSKVPRATRFARRAWKLASALGVGIALCASPATAQSVSLEQAPAEWVRYAGYATKTITTWLEAQSEAAVRLRTYLDATRSAPDQPTAPLMLKIWIDKDGKVSRIEHTPFAHDEANADLRALIVGGELDVSPPAGMLLPLRILVQLPPGSVPAVPSDSATKIGASTASLSLASHAGAVSSTIH